MSIVSKTITRIASLVLDLDDTRQPLEQLAVLNDFLAKHDFTLETGTMEKFLHTLKKKHLVDSITIANSGEVLASSGGNGIGEGMASTALFDFISKQLSKPETVLIKMPSGWHMIFPLNQKMYIIKAGANLSTIELRALAREIEEFIKRKDFKTKKANSQIKKAF